jgi:hypothetical protein
MFANNVLLALEHGSVRAKGKDFHGSIGSIAKEHADHGEDEFRHELTVVTSRHAVPARGAAANANC